MATTSIWSVKGWLGKVLMYVENPEKTESPKCVEQQQMNPEGEQSLSDVIAYAIDGRKTEQKAVGEKEEHLDDEGMDVMQRYVSGVNCSPLTARSEMLAVKKRFGKDEGVMAYHGYQSFAPGEAYPAMAHEIGLKLAQSLWGEKYQVLVATHLDKKNHLHNHFIVNTVSFVDGIRYHRTKQDYYQMRKQSDALCKEYGLSVIEHAKEGKAKHYGEWRAEQEGRPTWRGIIKEDVDAAMEKAATDRQFYFFLREKGYSIQVGKDITVRPPGKERGVKLARNFGEAYTEEAICKRILIKRKVLQAQAGEKHSKKSLLVCRVSDGRKVKRRIKGLRGLYLHYCYCLGILPKERQISAAQMHFLYREDLRKLKSIISETKLLCANRIETSEQLLAYREGLEKKICQLTDQRKHLRYKKRSIREEETLTEMKAEIAAISRELGELREGVKLCNNISMRSVEIKEKIAAVRQEKWKEKEEAGHDKRRRGSRSDRSDVIRGR